MKNKIIKQYSELINDMSIAHDNIVNDLRFHINLLEKRVLELEGGRAEQALDEFNEVVTAPHEETVAKYMAENGRLRLENEKLRKEVRSIRAKLGKTTQTKTPTTKKEPAKHGKGSVMMTCQICGKGFFAKSKLAKYCKACRKAKTAESMRKWKAKQAKK